MRTEQIASKALEKVNFDRYLLSNILFARIDEPFKSVKSRSSARNRLRPVNYSLEFLSVPYTLKGSVTSIRYCSIFKVLRSSAG